MGSVASMHRRVARRPSPRSVRALAPRPVGWRTTDADEIALRRERASSELMRSKPLEPSELIFSTFEIASPSGTCYEVEIRSLLERENSCSCPDFRTNGLATCKHVEAVIARLRRTAAGRSALGRGGRSTRVEVFMRRSHQSRPAVEPGAARAAHLARRGLLSALAVPAEPDGGPEAEERRRTRAEDLLRSAERKREMTGVLCAGGFVAEAAAPAHDAVDLALAAVAVRHALAPEGDGGPLPESLLCGPMLVRAFVDGADVDLVRRLRACAGAEAPDPRALLEQSGALLRRRALPPSTAGALPLRSRPPRRSPATMHRPSAAPGCTPRSRRAAGLAPGSSPRAARAPLRIARSVPGGSTFPLWSGTTAIRVGSVLWTNMAWLPLRCTFRKPARSSARARRVPLTCGSFVTRR